jgi:hypothetical protein
MSSKIRFVMKVLLFFAMVSLIPLAGLAQPSVAPIPPDLTAAFGKGDVSTISSYFADNVVLKLSKESVTLVKADAAAQLREFFAAHPVKSFRVMPPQSGQEGKKNYETGELVTDSGKYTVHIQFTEPESNKQRITALKFEE